MKIFRSLLVPMLVVSFSTSLFAQFGDGSQGGPLEGEQLAFFEGSTKDGSVNGESFADLPVLNPAVQFATGLDGLEFKEPFKLEYYGAQTLEDIGPIVWHETLYEITVCDANQKLKLEPGEYVTIDFTVTLLDCEWAPKDLYCLWDWMGNGEPEIFNCPPNGNSNSAGRPGDWFSAHLQHGISVNGFETICYEIRYCDFAVRDYTGIVMNPSDEDRLEGAESNCIPVFFEGENPDTDWVTTRLAKPCAHFTGTLELRYQGVNDGDVSVRFNVHAENATGGSNVELMWGTGEDQEVGVGAGVFYKDSAYDTVSDEEAIAPDKKPLLDLQTATFDNYTSYSRGINGIFVDVWGLSREAQPDDFVFRQGNDNCPDHWDVAPNPDQIRTELGGGKYGSDRVWLTWENEEIRNIWLQVKMPDFEGCDSEDPFTFYFGNIIGETGSGDSSVSLFDLLTFRQNFPSEADIFSVADFDRSEAVDIFDLLHFRRHFGKQLVDLITPTPKN